MSLIIELYDSNTYNYIIKIMLNSYNLYIIYIIFFIIGGLFGAIFSSFYSLVIYRIPRNQSLLGRSICLCGKVIKIKNNIPILGYIMLKGKASCCSYKIPINFFIFEFLSFIISGYIYLLYGSFYLAIFIILYGTYAFIYAYSKKVFRKGIQYYEQQ